MTDFMGENGQVYERAVEVGPRTVVVLQGVKKLEPERKHTGKGKRMKTARRRSEENCSFRQYCDRS